MAEVVPKEGSGKIFVVELKDWADREAARALFQTTRLEFSDQAVVKDVASKINDQASLIRSAQEYLDAQTIQLV